MSFTYPLVPSVAFVQARMVRIPAEELKPLERRARGAFRLYTPERRALAIEATLVRGRGQPKTHSGRKNTRNTQGAVPTPHGTAGSAKGEKSKVEALDNMPPGWRIERDGKNVESSRLKGGQA